MPAFALAEMFVRGASAEAHGALRPCKTRPDLAAKPTTPCLSDNPPAPAARRTRAALTLKTPEMRA